VNPLDGDLTDRRPTGVLVRVGRFAAGLCFGPLFPRRTNCALEAFPTIGPQLDGWLGICFASWLRSSLGRLGWGFIIALQPPVNRADWPDILSGSLFRTARPPEIRIQQSANYGLPLINQVRIVVHCPVPLLSSQYNIKNGATRGDIPRHNQKLTHYPATPRTMPEG
jgi:hypothetical protein